MHIYMYSIYIYIYINNVHVFHVLFYDAGHLQRQRREAMLGHERRDLSMTLS